MRIAVSVITIFLVFAVSVPAGAQYYCDDPPSANLLTGESVTVSGLGTEGNPSAYSWYITPPDDPTPSKPTSQLPEYTFTPDTPGLWSVALVADYDHQAPGGGLWTSDDCVTIQVSSVVSAISLGASQITTEEELSLNGHSSQWAPGVVPEVVWSVDGLPFGSCNGAPPPSSPLELNCTVPAQSLDAGWHTAGLLLTDPNSGQTSFSSGDFEVIEVVPLSADFTWNPPEPDPGDSALFTATTNPPLTDTEINVVMWDFDDGTGVHVVACPHPYFSCLQQAQVFELDGWYDVTVTVETDDETASKTHRIKVGDPVEPPVASFSATPNTASLYQSVVLDFDGDCDGACEWSWSFDDGSQSSTENAVHAWEIPDTYTVALTVTNQSGTDSITHDVTVSGCWSPTSPSQAGICYGGPVSLTGASGGAWRWSTGDATQLISAPFDGAYWVNVDDGADCWGHSATTVVLSNCGDPGGDSNLDSTLDAADLAALIPELTDGDGDTVVGAGGGDLTAPGGDVTGEGLLRAEDLLSVMLALFD